MRRFVLGVGAQKAATSWLYTQFFREPHFRPAAHKEMHVLDALYLDHVHPLRAKIHEQFVESMNAHPKDKEDRFNVQRYHMVLDRCEYLRYYDGLLDGPDCFSCDITPSYAGLPEEALEFVQSGFAERGIRTLVTFVMREPVSRVESAVRMRLRNSKELSSASTEDLMRLIRQVAGSPSDKLRSSYRTTVDRIFSRFERDRVFVGFYETLFGQEELAKLSSVLGIGQDSFNVSERVNETNNRYRYPKEFIADLRGLYDDEYAFAVDDLGLDPSIWEAQIDALIE